MEKFIIVSGGDTGSDCIGTAHRQGCKSVTQIEIMPKPVEGPEDQIGRASCRERV